MERVPELALIWLRGNIAVAGLQQEETMGVFWRQLKQISGYHQLWRSAPASVKQWQAYH
ncbi:hypothetical protein [Hymenobacter sp. YC55]|uniref:hypothetical protein n=1 Tax=Hymenobacter sp. YC55 TaxID=3034019 RepID=UPI0023F6A902|nr:hypothetical protein [Hymenobacter sp. YC55]MDF7810658.1 hypothetical protein [Hymenobacter sp. YC55]